MTNQEAIETLKTAMAEVEWGYPIGYAAAFDLAVKALKKQEPMPVNVTRNFNNYEFDHCPICGRDFYGPYKRPLYCDKCGQAVKWDK